MFIDGSSQNDRDERKSLMAALEITELRKEFGGVIALAGVDISIELDKIVGIIGPNGSGKTHPVQCRRGRVQADGRLHPLAGSGDYRQTRLQNCPQGLGADVSNKRCPTPGLSVRENVSIAHEHGRSRSGPAQQLWNSPDEILSFVGLADLGDTVAVRCPSEVFAVLASP